MIIEFDMKQGSDEWHKARARCFSASEFNKIYTATGKQSSQAGALVEKIAHFIETGELPEMGFSGKSMNRGHEYEPHAHAFYEMATGITMQSCGLVYKDGSKRISASPDGIQVIIDGDKPPVIIKGLEIKCPEEKQHLKTLEENILPVKHFHQVQGCMYVCGCKEWDFLSYHPDHEQFLITVERDDVWINNLEIELMKVLGRVSARCAF